MNLHREKNAYRQTKNIPNYNILVFHLFVPLHRIRDTVYLFLTLICKLTSRPKLPIFIFCDPKMMLSKLGSFGNDAIWMCEQKLSG